MRVTPGQQTSSNTSLYFISTKSQFHPESQGVGTGDGEGTQDAPCRVLEVLTVWRAQFLVWVQSYLRKWGLRPIASLTHQQYHWWGSTHTIIRFLHHILLLLSSNKSSQGSPGETRAPLCGPALTVTIRQPEVTGVKLQVVVAQASSTVMYRRADSLPHT